MECTDRQRQILDFLSDRQFASVSELAELLFTSGATVRREIKRLEEKGLLESVYGGVVLREYRQEPVPVYLRDGDHAAEKEKLAWEASQMIRDGQTVMLDASSTVRRICRHILDRKGLTVITNNLRVCQELKNSNIRVICTGGTLLPRRECFVGHLAEEFLKGIHADILFFSSQGLSAGGMITDSSEEEIALRKVMLSCADRQIFLCDRSKLHKTYPIALCHTSAITRVLLSPEQP